MRYHVTISETSLYAKLFNERRNPRRFTAFPSGWAVLDALFHGLDSCLHEMFHWPIRLHLPKLPICVCMPPFFFIISINIHLFYGFHSLLVHRCVILPRVPGCPHRPLDLGGINSVDVITPAPVYHPRLKVACRYRHSDESFSLSLQGRHITHDLFPTLHVKDFPILFVPP